MATTLQLERIAALVTKLDPVANKQRGMRIEADDWNVIIDVLRGILQIDRTQEDSAQSALEQRFATIDHVHLGQVDVTWLDADLQTKVGGAQTGGSALTRTALGETNQKITGLGAEVARLGDLTERQQTLIDRGAVDAADRSKTLSQFDARFAGIENLRTLVGTVSNDVTGLRGNLDTVLALRSSLSDAAGNPINVSDLKAQVGDLQALRDNLKGVDGNLLRLRDVEVRLNELGDAVGSGAAGGLDTRIATATTKLQDTLTVRFDQRDATLQQLLTDGIAASEGRVRTNLNEAVDARAQAIDASVGTRIAESEARTNAGVDARVAASAQMVAAQASDSSTRLIDQRLVGLPDQVRATTTELIATLRTDLANEISTSINASLGASLNAQFSSLQDRFASRIGAIETRVGDFETRIPGLVVTTVDGLRAELAAGITNQINAGIDNVRGNLQSAINEQISTGLATGQAELGVRIGAAVDTRLANLNTLVVNSVADATRDLPQRVGTEVAAQLDVVNVSGQIRSSTADLTTQLRGEFNQALANQQARTSSDINSSVTLLRGEIGATRSDLSTQINDRVRATPPRVITRPGS